MRVERLRERLHSYVQAQAWDAAELNLERWAQAEPRAFEPALHHCRLHLLRHHHRDAFVLIADAVRQRSCPAELLLDTLLCLQELAAGALMPAALRACEDIESARLADLTRAASVLLRFGLSDEAARLLSLAGEQAPTAPEFLLNQAFLEFYVGNTNAAEAVLERLIRGPQDVAMAHWLLSRQRRQTQSSNHVTRLQQRLTLTGLHDDDRAYLGFALFKELDDLGKFEPAWQALSEANERLAKLRPYDALAIDRRFQLIKQQSIDTSIKTTAVAPSVASQLIPIFIVGMHRSGTSLLEHLISRASSVLACGETQRLRAAIAYAMNGSAQLDAEKFWNEIAQDTNLSAAPAHFFELTVGLTADTRFVTEKWPLNFQYLGLIRRAFPNAKVIHMCRDPLDLCFANYRERLGDSAAHLNSLTGLAHFHKAYLGLMAHWHQRYPGFILDVHYEELVQDPQTQLQRVTAFCGLDPLPPDPSAAPRQRVVATPSAAQVRQPVHTTSVGRWQAYRRQLAPLERLLATHTQASADCR